MKTAFAILRVLVLFICLAGVLSVLAATLLGCSGLHGYVADQFSQLRLVYVAALLLMFIPLLILRSRLGTFVAGSTLCLNLTCILPFYFTTQVAGSNSTPDSDATIELVTINVFGANNHHYEKVIEFVQLRHPQLLCLNEINKPWLERLNAALPEYKYQFDDGISGGSAIFSRIPIEQMEQGEEITAGHPRRRCFGLRGKFMIGGKQVILIAEHTPAPSGIDRWKSRNAELKRLGAEAGAAAVPLILVGDLNSTPWSPYFHELLQTGHLVDSELGNGIQPSWNALMLVPPMVPIDHCLTSNQFVILNRSLGPNVGSDHLPVYVKLRLAARKT